MTPDEGDKITLNGEEWTVVQHMAYRGNSTCTSPWCTRDGRRPLGEPGCYGWHCSQCHAPTSMMGHKCPVRN
jgi:hypothetical protein